MQTPNNRAGRLTERVMAKVREALPELPTHEYNRTYEAVLEVLTAELVPLKIPSGKDAVRFPGGGGMFVKRGHV